MIELRPEERATVERILAEYVDGCEVRAFGSRVRGPAKPYSDLDLAVYGTARLDADALRRLREAFEESELSFRVDVLDAQGLASSFRAAIEPHSEVIQRGEP